VKRWLRAHIELTGWIDGHVPDAKKLLNEQILKETGKALSASVLDDSFGRLQVTYDPLRGSLMRAAQLAFDAGFLGRQMPDLPRLYDLTLLNEVLAEKGKRSVE
jgi:NitT/TauT family transport system substrate-binding protein